MRNGNKSATSLFKEEEAPDARLLTDVMAGNGTLFTREDAICRIARYR
jgi:glucose-6-phosphate 1-dehydrogenase